MGSHSSRLRQKIVDVPDVAAGFGQYRPGPGPGSRDDVLAASNRINELKSRYRDHAKRYSPWQHLGDKVQGVWQYPATPLSQHAAIAPPAYSELVKIENQLANLFRDPERFAEEKTPTQRALDELERKFDNYDTDSRHGRVLVKTVVKIGAMLPAAPAIVGSAPVVGATAAAIATAFSHTAIENAEAALDGTTLSWTDLMGEAAKAGGSAFVEVFVLTKFSPYLLAKFPKDIGARISDEQLASLSVALGNTLSRAQLTESVSTFTAELWANLLSSASATCFELTFDLLRSKAKMTLGEFASSLVANMLTAGGLQVLALALSHAKALVVPIRRSLRSRPLHDELQAPANGSSFGAPAQSHVPLRSPLDHLHVEQAAASERKGKSSGSPSIEDLAEPLKSACGPAHPTAAVTARGGTGSVDRNRTGESGSEQAFGASGPCGDKRPGS
jgi:hypothetical protein